MNVLDAIATNNTWTLSANLGAGTHNALSVVATDTAGNPTTDPLARIIVDQSNPTLVASEALTVALARWRVSPGC